MGATGLKINETLVAQLVSDQFPQWAHLPIIAASPQGWDNRTFRLGDALAVRLPSAEGYAHQIRKERRWLPYLARHLRIAVPTPIKLGRPTAAFPFDWSVNAWQDGHVLSRTNIVDEALFAAELGSFLAELRAVPAKHDAPRPGPATAYRGGPFAFYLPEARTALRALGAESPATRRLIDEAVGSQWNGPPVWFHGDFSVDNLLIDGGHLSGVLDFGCCGMGDPACDLVIAFTYLSDVSRSVFRQSVGLDDHTWRRARGWALWKAAITLVNSGATQTRRLEQQRALAAVLRDQASD